MSVAQPCLTLETPWTIAHKALLSMEFSRQEHWGGLPFPSPGHLPDSGIKPESLELQADSSPGKTIDQYSSSHVDQYSRKSRLMKTLIHQKGPSTHSPPTQQVCSKSPLGSTMLMERGESYFPYKAPNVSTYPSHLHHYEY